ncbi:hypothetical protein AXI58_13075 [Bacillus nakamurai]|uniref:Transcriptional regulator LacI/GalR-like sensor domain-containing protein n=1 Tax=Bacillus nakamurai TaxID=1793963 RepID=A0A150FA09_9BACI|nr:hypothetical protein AXI58_13075 [Bacillus nakamurai]
MKKDGKNSWINSARLAVDRFTEKGLHRIAIITTSIIRKISPRVERIAGYKKALESHDLLIREEYMKTADADDIPSVLSELFSLDTPPEAILAGNDIVLVEVLKYMKEKNMAIPEDAAVIGIDEVSFASFFTPPVTTIVQPAVEMAKGAADILLRQIKKNESEAEWMHRYKPSLIARYSG